MSHFKWLSAAIAMHGLSVGAFADQVESPVDFVLTEMGTQNEYNTKRDGCSISCGNVYPVVMRPWGFGGFSPYTTNDRTAKWFYDYKDQEIHGIRHTHQPSPWVGDYGTWGFMPVQGFEPSNKSDGHSKFVRETEVFKPHLYSVELTKSYDDKTDYNIKMEITPSVHGAIARFTYPASELPGLMVDPFKGGSVSLSADKKTIVGISTRDDNKDSVATLNLHFVLRFDREVVGASKKLSDGGIYVKFPETTAGEQVTVWIASSLISAEQALENLKEVEGKTFDSLMAEAKAEWNERLGKIQVETDDLDKRRTFYSCFYRTMLFPMALWERDATGKIVHWSPSKGGVKDGYYFAGTGFWDTFRALFPLMNLIAPEVNGLMIEGLQHCYNESGWLPEWSSPGLYDCMVGNNSASVIADAILSGVDGNFTISNIWEAVEHGANHEHPKQSSTGRKGVEDYIKMGYVPRDIKESVPRTLEYAYDDWCIARLAEAIGKTNEVAKYELRSHNWTNVFDKAEGRKIVCGRNRDGSFNASFNPFSWGGDFTEGCAHHWTWSVFHDIPGLIEAMGGSEAFEKRLDEIFEMNCNQAEWSAYGSEIHEITEMKKMNYGQYAHGNQPIQHMIYLYDWVGAHEKAQQRTREVMERFYRPVPDGYCGDEDNGQTSAWYVWSALGMYPVCPGSGEYALGAPLFDRATVSLPNGKQLVITAKGASQTNVFTRVTVGGQTLSAPIVSRAKLLEGTTMRFLSSDVVIDVGEIESGADEGWAFENGVLTLTGEGPYVLTGTNTNGTVRVRQVADATVTFKNLVLTVDGKEPVYEVGAGEGTGDAVAATILLSGDSVLRNTSRNGDPTTKQAAIFVNNGSSVVFDVAPGLTDVEATLTAQGGNGGAGIGGSRDHSTGTITIEGGTIIARGGDYAAGIGGGFYEGTEDEKPGTVIITGGVVDAVGQNGSDGIGAGYKYSKGLGYEVLIRGGTVTLPTVGEGLTTVWDNGTVLITGAGTINDFSEASKLPWNKLNLMVEKVVVGEGVRSGKNVLAGLEDDIVVSAPLSFMRETSADFVLGGLSPAEAKAISVVDGKVVIVVGVKGGIDLEKRGEWTTKGTTTISFPAEAEQGFYILKSE